MMLKFAPYILKSLWRHRTRTALTVSGAAVALVVEPGVEVVGDPQGLEPGAFGKGRRLDQLAARVLFA